MRLTVYTDYSLRTMIYLALRPGALVTIQEISEAYGISRNHMMKVAHELGRREFVETVRGRGGGLRLKADPARITVGDIVRATEDDWRMVECFDAKRNRCVITPACQLKGILQEGLDAMFDVLDKYTLAQLVSRQQELARRLGITPELVDLAAS